jgi:single-stranded-DNA-specific exonuclease
MISVSGKTWEQKKTNKNLIEKLKQDYDFSEILSKLAVSRKFDQTELSTIDNTLKLNNVFYKNIDFIKSIEIVSNSINKGENICVLGDYDVDGSAATSLFIRFLNSINHPFFYYIPDREKDGYGATKKLFEKLILKKPKLVILLDCGSTSHDAINFLNKNDIKSIIIDHHEINKPFPKANSIINPKKDNGYIKYEYLCATSLSYFFLDLLSLKIKSKIKISNFLIYVLLATVCDVMPLRKLNRLIALVALKHFDLNKNIAINEILDLTNKKKRLDINDLGYLIGPILNAGGRLGKSGFASELLSSDNLKIVNKKAIELIKLNNKRKEIETLTLNQINLNKIERENKSVIIYYSSNINEGLIGIIAARLKDYFYKPVIVITTSGKILKGSARSIYNYNVGRAIKKSLDKNLIINGGGHNMAAGFSLEKNNLNKFKDFIINDFLGSISDIDFKFSYDAEISSHAFNNDFYSDVKKLEPFGTGNPDPIFLFKDLRTIKSTSLNNKHVSAILKSKVGHSINSISFNSLNDKVGEYLLNYKKTFSVLGHINENIWNNKKALQLIIKDLII